MICCWSDFVSTDSHGNYHVFEAKPRSGRLTKNQSASSVFDMTSPSNTVNGVGGGVITPLAGKAGKFEIATGNRDIGEVLGCVVLRTMRYSMC